MIDNIDDVKKLLEHVVTIENLQKYKEAIKSFLEYYTKNELKMEQYYMRDKKGIEKKVSIIRSIDQKMNDLTENLLETNKGHLDILQKMGQIQGLLVNLYV